MKTVLKKSDDRVRERETERHEGWEEEFKSFDYVLQKGGEMKRKRRI